jgi:hypothetical protein
LDEPEARTRTPESFAGEAWGALRISSSAPCPSLPPPAGPSPGAGFIGDCGAIQRKAFRGEPGSDSGPSCPEPPDDPDARGALPGIYGPARSQECARRGGSPLCTIDPRAAASRDARPRRLTRITSLVSRHIRERQRWGHWGGEELPAERTDGTTCPTHRRARRRTRPVTGRAQRSRRQTGVHLLARAIEVGSRRVQSQPCICRLQDGVLDRFGECEAIPQLRATVTSSWARKIGAQRVLSLARCTLVFV